MSHTPGPWYPSFHANICIGVQNSPDGFTEMICNSILPETDEQYEKWGKQIEADMKLIAAAPELLEALEELYLSVYGGNSTSLEDAMCRSVKDDLFEQKIISAIKKAKGI